MAAALRDFVRDACAALLQAAGVSAYRRRRPGELLVLMFHRVLPEELCRDYPLRGLAVTPGELGWVLRTLLPHFAAGTVSAMERLQREDSPAERPLLAISFDDGQWDNAEFAAPVLRELGVTASFYLPTDFIGGARLLWHDRAAFAWADCGLDARDREQLLARLGADGRAPALGNFLEALKRVPQEQRLATVAELERSGLRAAPEWARMMSWDDARALHAAGHEIGSHGCSHGLLPQQDAATQLHELAASRAAIAAEIGTAPLSLCYPNGSYDQRSVALAGETGYANAVTTRWGINAMRQPRMELLRCDMDARRLLDRRGELSPARMAMRLAGFAPGLRA